MDTTVYPWRKRIQGEQRWPTWVIEHANLVGGQIREAARSAGTVSSAQRQGKGACVAITETPTERA
jgi:hypothetical protein